MRGGRKHVLWDVQRVPWSPRKQQADLAPFSACLEGATLPKGLPKVGGHTPLCLRTALRNRLGFQQGLKKSKT